MPSRCVWDVPYTRRNPQINTPTTRPLREAFSLRRRSPSAQTSGASCRQGRGDGVSTSALFFLEKCGFELNPRGRAQGLGEKRPALCPAELASSPESRVSAWTPEVEGEGPGGPAAPGAALTRAVARGGAGPSTCADVRGGSRARTPGTEPPSPYGKRSVPFDRGSVLCARRLAAGSATHASAFLRLCFDSGGNSIN